MSNDRVALVTGASRGIGRGIALTLGAHGWSVAVNYHSSAAAAEEVVSAIQSSGGRALAVQANVGALNEHQPMLDQIMTTYGRIDLLVNNAGIAPRQRADLLEMTEDSYDEVMAVNLKGPVFLSQRVAKTMIQLLFTGAIDAASIINIGSISAYTSSVNRGEYCLSKAGMGMMTLLLADRLSEYGINVYEIRPGIIETDMTGRVKEKYDQSIDEGLTPIRRWGQPDDVAKAVLALVEGSLPFSTGEIINVDGGFHMRRL